MLVKCRACNKKIDRKTAFKVVKNGKNEYYCNEKEYLDKLEKTQKDKKIKEDTINLIFELFGYEITNSALFKELKELSEVYTYDNVYSYINDNSNFLNKTINGKNFSNEYGKIRYFFTIIKNNIVDYLEVKRDEIEEEEYIRNIEYDIHEIKYKNKSKRRALYEIEMELIAEDE